MTKQQFNNRKAERGNALFLILIAVALFAALSYAVTQSGRGGGSVSKETALLDSAQLTQYAAAIRTSVTRMILTGTPDTGADGVGLRYDGTGSNALFNTNGGGVVAQTPPPNVVCSSCTAGTANSAGPAWRYKAIKTGGNSFYVRGVGSTAGDSFTFIGVNSDACLAINRGLGFTAPAPLGQHTAAFNVATDASEGLPTSQAAAVDAAEGNNASTIGHTLRQSAFACIGNIQDDNGDGTEVLSGTPRIYYHTLIEK